MVNYHRPLKYTSKIIGKNTFCGRIFLFHRYIDKEIQLNIMETPKAFIIQFNNKDEARLELIESKDGVSIFQKVKYQNDLELNEKYTLTLNLVLTPLTKEEKKSVLLYNMFNGKELPNTEIKITKRNEGE